MGIAYNVGADAKTVPARRIRYLLFAKFVQQAAPFSQSDPRGPSSQRRARQLGFPTSLAAFPSSLPARVPPRDWSSARMASYYSRFFRCVQAQGLSGQAPQSVYAASSLGIERQLAPTWTSDATTCSSTRSRLIACSTSTLPHRSFEGSRPDRSAAVADTTRPHCSREQRLPPHPGSHSPTETPATTPSRST